MKKSSTHVVSLTGQEPSLQVPGGSMTHVDASVFPILERLSIRRLLLAPRGVREPHWHPATAEMGYVLQGRARMTVLSPGASVDTYELGPGDVYFIPRAYPHHIEDIGQGDIHFLVFFDRETPGDIGCKAAVSAYSREVLAATFGCDVATLPPFPFTAQDPLIVPRGNPVDR